MAGFSAAPDIPPTKITETTTASPTQSALVTKSAAPL